MPHPSNRAVSPRDAGDGDHPPQSPVSPLPPRDKPSTVRKLAEQYERPQLHLAGAEPAKPKRDLREEYKDPWTRQKEEQLRRERVRKGDGGLDPQLREPWERARDEETSATDNAGRDGADADADGDGDAATRLEIPNIHDVQVPQPASLHLLRTEPTLLPARTTPFAYAFDPWLQKYPEDRQYLEPSTPSSSMSSDVPSQGSSMHSGEVSARTDEAFPEIPFDSIAVYLRDRDEVEVRAKILHVRTLLIRCAVLVRTAMSLEQAEWKAFPRWRGGGHDDEAGRMGKLWYKAYSKAGRVAEKAEQMARALGIDGLQARTWYWKGKADCGRRYWDEAATAFWRAEQFDREKHGVASVEEYGKIGLTPIERRDVEWLRKACEKRNELVQQRRQMSAWAGTEAWDEDLKQLVGEQEEEGAMELEPLNDKGNRDADGEKLADVAVTYPEGLQDAINAMRSKYKMQDITPLSLEEQDYIMNGVPIPKKNKEDLKTEGVQDKDGDGVGGLIGTISSEGTTAASDRVI